MFKIKAISTAEKGNQNGYDFIAFASTTVTISGSDNIPTSYSDSGEFPCTKVVKDYYFQEKQYPVVQSEKIIPNTSIAFSNLSKLFTIQIEKTGLDKVYLSYEVPLGRYIQIETPATKLTPVNLPKNFYVKNNLIVGYVIYDEQLLIEVSDEQDCIYSITLIPKKDIIQILS